VPGIHNQTQVARMVQARIIEAAKLTQFSVLHNRLCFGPADGQLVPNQENRPAREKPMRAVRRSEAVLCVTMYKNG
jgi:hypothetical protein